MTLLSFLDVKRVPKTCEKSVGGPMMPRPQAHVHAYCAPILSRSDRTHNKQRQESAEDRVTNASESDRFVRFHCCFQRDNCTNLAAQENSMIHQQERHVLFAFTCRIQGSFYAIFLKPAFFLRANQPFIDGKYR